MLLFRVLLFFFGGSPVSHIRDRFCFPSYFLGVCLCLPLFQLLLRACVFVGLSLVCVCTVCWLFFGWLLVGWLVDWFGIYRLFECLPVFFPLFRRLSGCSPVYMCGCLSIWMVGWEIVGLFFCLFVCS